MREDIPVTSKRKICIVGFADGHRDAAPWDDTEMEFWGLNRLHAVLPHRISKFTRWFELHSLQKFYVNDREHQEFLHDFSGPVYVRPTDAGLFEIPNEVEFPLGTIMKEFHPYFTNTISWLLALALLMLKGAADEYRADPENVPAPELHVYGVDMAQDSLLQAEYAEQRPSCEFFLGMAAAMGIQLMIPEGADLLVASHLYGFEDTDPIRGKRMERWGELQRRKEQVQAQLNNGDAERAKLVGHVQALEGAQQEIQYNLRNLMPPPEGEPFTPPEVSLNDVAGQLAGLTAAVAALTEKADEPQTTEN